MAPHASALRLEDVIAEYLERAEARTRIVGKGRMSETTVESYRTRLRDYVTPTIGRRKLSALGKGDVLRVLGACHAAGLSEWGTHGVLTALRAVLRFARESDYMTLDPFQGVPRDRLPAQRSRSEARALRPEEARSCSRSSVRRRRSSGRRTTEAALGARLATTRSDVCSSTPDYASPRRSGSPGATSSSSRACSTSAASLRARGRTRRPASSRRSRSGVSVPSRSCRALAGLSRRSTWGRTMPTSSCAPAAGRRSPGTTPRARSAKRGEAGERAKLGHVTPHVLRRTLGTALSDAGVPVAAAAAILGHSVEVSHSTYVKDHRDALERDQAREALVELGLGVTRT